MELQKNNKGLKFDGGKPPVELLSSVAMIRTAKVLDFGRIKYDTHNWRKGMEWSRLLGAALRHLFAYLGGEDKDPETGLSHLDHAACCIMFLQEYEEKGIGEDDRYKRQAHGES